MTSKQTNYSRADELLDSAEEALQNDDFSRAELLATVANAYASMAIVDRMPKPQQWTTGFTLSPADRAALSRVTVEPIPRVPELPPEHFVENFRNTLVREFSRSATRDYKMTIREIIEFIQEVKA